MASAGRVDALGLGGAAHRVPLLQNTPSSLSPLGTLHRLQECVDPLWTCDFRVNYSKRARLRDGDYQVGGLLGSVLGINTCGQREGSRMGQGEKLAILEPRWTFRCVVTRGQNFISGYFSVFTCKLPPRLAFLACNLGWSSWRKPGQFPEGAEWGSPPQSSQGFRVSFLKGGLDTASQHLLHLGPGSLLWVSVNSIIWIWIPDVVALVFLYRRTSVVVTSLGC